MKKIGFLSFGHWSASPYSQVRSGADALIQSIELAEAVEDLGADGAYFRVHHFAQQLASPFPLLAAIGARTKRIEIGTAVIDMRYENPLYMMPIEPMRPPDDGQAVAGHFGERGVHHRRSLAERRRRPPSWRRSHIIPRNTRSNAGQRAGLEPACGRSRSVRDPAATRSVQAPNLAASLSASKPVYRYIERPATGRRSLLRSCGAS